jgi:hypothetical protein
MKFLPLLAALLLVCCSKSDNSVDSGSSWAPTGLRASSIDSSSVKLLWDSVAHVPRYEVMAIAKATGDTLRASTPSSSCTIDGLAAGEYLFMVRSISVEEGSAWRSIRWAPATRFTQDAQAPGTTLRMYEWASTSGSSLALDPSVGGPRNASVGGQWQPRVQLAIYTSSTSSTEFSIGSTYAFLPFRNADRFDSSSYIGRTLYAVSSLNDHFLSVDLESDFVLSGTEAGNVASFILPNERLDGKGHLFLLRYGNGAGRHYARIFVKNVGGKLLQGTAPNRYVEIEMSWQSVAGVPYA